MNKRGKVTGWNKKELREKEGRSFRLRRKGSYGLKERLRNWKLHDGGNSKDQARRRLRSGSETGNLQSFFLIRYML